MMKLQMESVVEEFQIPGGGKLQFNPADPALFLRLEQLQDRVAQLDGSSPRELDLRLKKVLDETFGPGNDLHSALGGVSLFAVTGAGNTVLEALLEALLPILREGAERCAQTC